MRIKVFVFVILGGLLVIGALFGVRNLLTGDSRAPDPAGVLSSSEAVATNTSRTANLITPASSEFITTKSNEQKLPPSLDNLKSGEAGGTTPKATISSTPAEKAAYIRSTVRKLEELSAENDQVSLGLIVSELTNSVKTIRDAARDAAIQFGSRDAIPNLKEAAGVVADPREKVAFLDAADFLELPSMTERAAQPRTIGPFSRPPVHQGRPAKQGQLPAAATPPP